MIKIHSILEKSYVDGPGTRTVVFMQGCPIRCPGCQNKHLWSPEGGEWFEVTHLARAIMQKSPHGNVTISGGEPFAQPAALYRLVQCLRLYGAKHIIVYSGYKLETIINSMTGVSPIAKGILCNIDALVDGPYISDLDHDHLTYRGSKNQRAIDIKKYLDTGKVVDLGWNNEIEITETGDLVMPVGFVNDFQSVGTQKNSPMCGQTRRA